MGWEAEVSELKKLMPGASIEEIEQEAAVRIRNTFPTYSEIPPAIQWVRAQPIVGPFISFAHEAIRTQLWNLKYAAKAMRDGHTAYGAKRFAGALTATTLATYGIQELTKAVFGISDEEEENFRSLLPDYEKDAQFIFWKNEDGEVEYSNISFNNPYSATTDKILAMMGVSGTQEDELLTNMLVKSIEVFEPFFQETIISQALLDVARNKNIYGSQVYNPEADINQKVADVFTHIGKTATPGTIERAAKRWYPAAAGRTLKGGQKPELSDELTSELTGVKFRKLDYAEALGNASFGSAQSLNNSRQIFNKVARSRGSVSEKETVEAYEAANRSRFRVFNRIARQVRAAKIGGLSNSKIVGILKNAGVSEADAKAVLRGVYLPLSISADTMKRARESGHPIPMRDIRQIQRKFRRKELAPRR